VKDSELLNALKTELEKFRTFNCKLKHETIIGTFPNDSIDIAGNNLEPIIDRLGFCKHNFRSVTINCAHTTAGFKFKNLIETISDHIENFQGELYISSADRLLCEIYLLDHKRGSLEKELAFYKLTNNTDVERERIQGEISHLVNNHSNLVAELELLRQTIVADFNQFTY